MIVLNDPDPRFRSRALKTLRPVWPCAEAANAAELDALLGEHAQDVEVVVLGPRLGMRPALETAAHIRDVDPSISSVLLAQKVDEDVLRAAVRSGVRDVIAVPCQDEQLKQAVGRARGLSRSLRARSNRGTRVTTVFSLKGGSGKSIVACNLGVHLAGLGLQGAALVDLDLQSGDLAVMLQVRPQWTIRDAAERGASLDEDALLGLLTRHSSGVRLLAAPLDPADADAVDPETVARVIPMLRASFPHVVVDCPAAFTEHVLTALDASDDCVFVCSLDVPSVKNAVMALRTLGELGFGRDRVRILLNRADEDVALTVGHVEKALGTKVDAMIPSTREITVSVNRGIPLAATRADHPLRGALSSLTGAQPPAPRGLLRRIRR